MYFMPLSCGQGKTLGLSDVTGCCGECLTFRVWLVGFICHKKAVVDAIEIGFQVGGAVVGVPESLIIRCQLCGRDGPVCLVKVLKNVPYGSGRKSRHGVSEFLNIYAVNSVDELVLEGIVHRFE